MSFYTGPERSAFLLPPAEAFFLENGVRTVDFYDASALVPVDTFDNRTGVNAVAVPKADRKNIPIPYEPLEHEDHDIDGVSIERLVEEYINNTMMKRKFLMSGRPDVFFAIGFSKFSYDILYHVHSGHMTTTMILFDESHKCEVFFEYDLAINTFSFSKNVRDVVLFGKNRDEWVRYFNDHFLEGIAYNEHHIGVINKYYGPVIEGLKVPLR